MLLSKRYVCTPFYPPPKIFSQPANIDLAQIKIRQKELWEELNTCRLLVDELRYLQKDPFLYSNLKFWIQVVNFSIVESDSWIIHGDMTKCKKAIDRAETYLHYVHQLVDYITTGRYYDGSSDGHSSEKRDGNLDSHEDE